MVQMRNGSNTFGQSLREMRRSKGVSQRELAGKVGVDFSYISKVENDRLPPPAADTIVKICEALGVAPEELLASSGKIPKQLREMLGASSSALQFVREAYQMALTDEEWGEMTRQMKRLRGD
jgi:transcriptional regulator with XRE-family HTH domain